MQKTTSVSAEKSTNGGTRRLLRNGPFFLTLSAMLFAVMAVAVRLAGIHGIPGSETTFVRFTFGLLTIAVIHSSGVSRVRLRRKWLLAARGLSGGLAILLYFASLSAARGPGGTPLTNSVMLGNSYFIYAPLFGALLIRERLRWGTMLMVAVALFGLYLVVQPDFSHVRTGDVYGFFAGVTSGVALVTVRALRGTEGALSVFFSLCTFGSAVALAAMLASGNAVIPNMTGWMILLVMAISSTFGQLSMTYAMRFSRAGEAGIIQMTTVVYSSLAGIVWFGDPFGAKVVVGAILVIASAAYISLAQSQDSPGD